MPGNAQLNTVFGNGDVQSELFRSESRGRTQGKVMLQSVSQMFYSSKNKISSVQESEMGMKCLL